jgi:hypothetical protein
VTGVNVLLKIHRGADQAFMRSISLPAKARRGAKIKVKVALQVVRGAKLNRTYTLQIPRDAKTGRQTLRLVGQDADQGSDAFTTIILGDDSDQQNEGGDAGPSTLDELAKQVDATARFDGVGLRLGRVRGDAFRDADYRISGQAESTIRITR